jgi:hypothetical protein
VQVSTFPVGRRTRNFLSTLNEILGEPNEEWVRVTILGNYKRKYVGKSWECGCRVTLRLETGNLGFAELMLCPQHATLIANATPNLNCASSA